MMETNNFIDSFSGYSKISGILTEWINSYTDWSGRPAKYDTRWGSYLYITLRYDDMERLDDLTKKLDNEPILKEVGFGQMYAYKDNEIGMVRIAVRKNKNQKLRVFIYDKKIWDEIQEDAKNKIEI